MALRTCRLVVIAGIAVAASALPAAAQSTGQLASASFTVSVTVVRSCGVSAPATLAPSSAPSSSVRVSCGRAPSTTPIQAGGILSVDGAKAPASISTSKTDGGLVVSVNF